jgi:hypothetical protein
LLAAVSFALLLRVPPEQQSLAPNSTGGLLGEGA